MQKNEFETERLLIRPTSVEDAKFILELYNTPQWIKNIGDRNIRDLEDAKNYIIDKMISQFDKLGYSNNTIIRKLDNKKIGTCGLYKRNGIQNVDLGFAFLPEFQKQGYAFESASKLVKVAFNKYNMTALNAITIKENTPSQNLLTKLGFDYIKIINIPNDDVDLLLYELQSGSYL